MQAVFMMTAAVVTRPAKATLMQAVCVLTAAVVTRPAKATVMQVVFMLTAVVHPAKRNPHNIWVKVLQAAVLLLPWLKSKMYGAASWILKMQ